MDKKYDARIDIIEEIVNHKKEIKRIENMQIKEEYKKFANNLINISKKRLEELEGERISIGSKLVEKKKTYEEKNGAISKELSEITKKKEALIKTMKDTQNKDAQLKELEIKFEKLEEKLNKNKMFIDEIDKTLKLIEYEPTLEKEDKDSTQQPQEEQETSNEKLNELNEEKEKLLEENNKYKEKLEQYKKAEEELTNIARDNLINHAKEGAEKQTANLREILILRKDIEILEEKIQTNENRIKQIDIEIENMQNKDVHKGTKKPKENKKDEYEFNQVLNVNGKIVEIAKMPDEQQDIEELTRYNLRIKEGETYTYKDVYASKRIYLDKIDKNERYKAIIEKFFDPDRIANIEKDAEKHKSNRLYMGHINRLDSGDYRISGYRGQKIDEIYNNFILNEYKVIKELKDKTVKEVKQLGDNAPAKITQDKFATIAQYNAQIEDLENKRPDLLKKVKTQENKNNESNKNRLVNEEKPKPQVVTKNEQVEKPNKLNNSDKNKNEKTEPIIRQESSSQTTNKQKQVQKQEKQNPIKLFFGNLINKVSKVFNNIKLGMNGITGKTKLISVAQKVDLKIEQDKEDVVPRIPNENNDIEKVAINRVIGQTVDKETYQKIKTSNEVLDMLNKGKVVEESGTIMGEEK